MDSGPFDSARLAVSQLLNVPTKNVLLTPSTTHALQIIMQSFLLNEGDELVTTDGEHGGLKSIAQYLSETRGVVVRSHHIDPNEGSKGLCDGLIGLINANTRLVAVSEIVGYTGWRPDLNALSEFVNQRKLLLLVDGAHAPGQGDCNPSQYPLWVGSGHKWLGGPNGTAFAYIRSELIPQLQPAALGDKYYVRRDADPFDLTRLESQGTSDVTRWAGLSAAIKLHLELGPELVSKHQKSLARYLRNQLQDRLAPNFRCPEFNEDSKDATSLLTFYWPPDRLKVDDLQEFLWTKHRIAVQLDFLHDKPAHGMRISCHAANSTAELDLLVDALNSVIH